MEMMHVLFSLFGMPVTAYALCMAAAAALGLLLLVGVQKKHGLRGDTADVVFPVRGTEQRQTASPRIAFK